MTDPANTVQRNNGILTHIRSSIIMNDKRASIRPATYCLSFCGGASFDGLGHPCTSLVSRIPIWQCTGTRRMQKAHTLMEVPPPGGAPLHTSRTEQIPMMTKQGAKDVRPSSHGQTCIHGTGHFLWVPVDIKRLSVCKCFESAKSGQY
jgi:hypothetical protein